MSTQTTFLGRLWQTIESIATHEVFPFLQHLWSVIQMDVIAVLKPIAEAELAKLDQALLTSGPEGLLKAFNATVPGVLQSAEAQAAGATIHDVITTVQGVIANATKPPAH